MKCVQVAYKWYYSYEISEEDVLLMCIIMPLFWVLQNNIRVYPTFREYMNMVFKRVEDASREEEENEGNE